MRNVALGARLEIAAHRQFITGTTASSPVFTQVDPSGAMGWVVDVYIGPLGSVTPNIIYAVPIASTALNLIAGVRVPVLLERSQQGKFTVMGRADTTQAGVQQPDGTILEPTYHLIEYNLAQLRVSFIADITYTLEAWGDKNWDDGGPWQRVTGTDAFGNVVTSNDPAVIDPSEIPPALTPTPEQTTTSQAILIDVKSWGPEADPDSLQWGTDPWGAPLQKLITQES